MGTVAERLAELTWQINDGDYDAFRRLVEAQGSRWLHNPPNAPVIYSVFGITIGLPYGLDPPTAYASVCMALFGEGWASLPDADEGMDLMNEEWARRSNAAKAAKSNGPSLPDQPATPPAVIVPRQASLFP